MRRDVLRIGFIVLGAAVGAGCDEAAVPARDPGPPVSFAEDLIPLLGASCAFVGCHDGQSRSNGLYLGPSVAEGRPTPAVIAEIYASLLSPAYVTSDLPRVTPGDPSRSFVMLKIDGCQNRSGLRCIGSERSPCGDRMPALSDPLPTAKRDLIHAWIARGAEGPAGDAMAPLGDR
jgi:hypothetical protein